MSEDTKNINELEVEVVAEKSLATRFREARLGPASFTIHLNGTVTLTWHVDDDDDRYVQVTDSRTRPTTYLVVSRDGKQARACVLSSFTELFGIVSDWTTTLSVESRRRG